MNNRSIPIWQYAQLIVSVVVTALCYAVLLNGHAVFNINGIEVAYLLRASEADLAVYYPNFAWVIHVLSRMVLLGVPILIGVSVVVFSKPVRNELTWVNVTLFLSVTVVCLLMTEFVLRMTGVVPGQLHYNRWVTGVDELREIPGFKADRNGLFVVDTAVAFACRSQSLSGMGMIPKADSLQKDAHGMVVTEVRLVFEDHQKLQGPLHYFAGNIGATATDRFDSLVAHYIDDPINEHGFYSIPFDTMVGGRPRVLLLGDSFTWGNSTSNKSLSFANTLLSRGMAVYNTGISGTDVPQYKRVLEVYARELKPHVAVVNFFMGNDVDYFERKPVPHVPIHFQTNAGNIQSYQDGQTFATMEDAYANVVRKVVIPQNSRLNRLLSKTAVTTLLWRFLLNQEVLVQPNFSGMVYPEKPIVGGQIREMMDFCDSLGIRFVLCVIPELEQGKLKGAGSVPGLFDSIRYHQPEMTSYLYNSNDGHFNDEGHLFYADYLEKLILAEIGFE